MRTIYRRYHFEDVILLCIILYDIAEQNHSDDGIVRLTVAKNIRARLAERLVFASRI